MMMTTLNSPGENRNSELCNECGESTAAGSGRFVNRVVDFNDQATRGEMGKPFPAGDYVCAGCDLVVRLH